MISVSSIPVKIFKKPEIFIYEVTIGGYILNKFSRHVFAPLQDTVSGIWNAVGAL